MLNDFIVLLVGFVLGMLIARWLLRRDVARAEKRLQIACSLERMRAREDRARNDAIRKAGIVSREQALMN